MTIFKALGILREFLKCCGESLNETDIYAAEIQQDGGWAFGYMDYPRDHLESRVFIVRDDQSVEDRVGEIDTKTRIDVNV